MTIKKIAATALMAATTSMSAFALPPSALGTIDNSTVLIGNITSDFFFVDLYTFTFASAGTLSSTEIAPVMSAPQFMTAHLNAKLYSGATVMGTDNNLTNGFSFANLAKGSYSLIIGGLATGQIGGGYGGYITAMNAAPVPEPESYAMLLAGLGVMGAMALRRHKRNQR